MLTDEQQQRVHQAALLDEEDRKAKSGLAILGSVIAVIIVAVVGVRLVMGARQPQPVPTPLAAVSAAPAARSSVVYVAPSQPLPTQQVQQAPPMRRVIYRARSTGSNSGEPFTTVTSAGSTEQPGDLERTHTVDARIDAVYASAIAAVRSAQAKRARDNSIGLPSDATYSENTVAALLAARDQIAALAPYGLPERQQDYASMYTVLNNGARMWAQQGAADVNTQFGGRPLNDPINSVRLDGSQDNYGRP